MTSHDGGPRGFDAAKIEAEKGERVESIMREVNEKMNDLDTPDHAVSGPALDRLSELNREGIKLVGRVEYRRRFDEEFGPGAADMFIKARDEDPA